MWVTTSASRKIRRRAVAVLVEVARTGTYEWHLEREGPHAPTEELESLRADYIGFLRGRNLAATTVGLHDWVLRRMLEFSGASTLEDVASFGAEQVAAVVGGFSGARTTRSLSTALPVVRRALDYLGGAGSREVGLSGLVMTPYSQRGGTVTFLPPTTRPGWSRRCAGNRRVTGRWGYSRCGWGCGTATSAT